MPITLLSATVMHHGEASGVDGIVSIVEMYKF